MGWVRKRLQPILDRSSRGNEALLTAGPHVSKRLSLVTSAATKNRIGYFTISQAQAPGVDLKRADAAPSRPEDSIGRPKRLTFGI
jgi:hypothetical protein